MNRREVIASSVLFMASAGIWTGPTLAQSTPLQIGVTIWPGWMPWWIVTEKKMFQSVGANAEIVFFKRHPDGMAAFAAKQLDAHHMILADVIIPASKGVPGQIVLITDESSGADGILAKPEITDIAGFKGRRVAYEFGGVSQLILTEALIKAGLKLDDIESINMASEDAGTAFMAGAVDVAVTWEPYLSQAAKDGKGKVIFSTKETPGLVPDLLVFRKETIDSRPADVQKVVDAWKMALEFIKTNEGEAIEIMAKASGISVEDMKVNLAGVKLYSLEENAKAFDPANPNSIFKTIADQSVFLKEQNVIDTIPDATSLVAGQFATAASKN